MPTEQFVDFAAKIHPEHTALLLVDIQNDFCHKDGALAKLGADTSLLQQKITNLNLLLEAARKASVVPIFIQATYNTPDSRYLSPVFRERRSRRNRSLPICAEGSWGWDFYGDIKPVGREIVVRKHRYSAFIDTELDLILRSKQIRTLVITGVATNVCVESTARDAFMKDYYVVMPEDCSATYEPEEIEKATFYNIEHYFGEVVSSKKIIEQWGIQSKTQEEIIKTV